MLEYDRIDLSEGIDINKKILTSKNVICAVIGILLIKILIMNNIHVMVVMICLQKLIVYIIYV